MADILDPEAKAGADAINNYDPVARFTEQEARIVLDAAAEYRREHASAAVSDIQWVLQRFETPFQDTHTGRARAAIMALIEENYRLSRDKSLLDKYKLIADLGIERSRRELRETEKAQLERALSDERASHALTREQRDRTISDHRYLGRMLMP